MHRVTRGRKARYARGVCAACLVGSLAACSSGGHKTTATTRGTTTTSTTTTIPPTTTLPTPAEVTTIKAWFAAHGQPLIAYERITASLATGKAPTAAACTKYLQVDLPHITKNENTIVALSQSIPNKQLESAVYADVGQKVLVGRGCGEAVLTHRTIPVGSPAVWAAVRAFSDGAHLWLARFGISI